MSVPNECIQDPHTAHVSTHHKQCDKQHPHQHCITTNVTSIACWYHHYTSLQACSLPSQHSTFFLGQYVKWIPHHGKPQNMLSREGCTSLTRYCPLTHHTSAHSTQHPSHNTHHISSAPPTHYHTSFVALTQLSLLFDRGNVVEPRGPSSSACPRNGVHGLLRVAPPPQPVWSPMLPLTSPVGVLLHSTSAHITCAQ